MSNQILFSAFGSMDITEDEKIKLNRLISLHENPNAPTKVVVFGKYNHGKSSFLNAWFEKKDLFRVSDIRETQTIQQEKDSKHNIIWFDTPGLDAEEKDDLKAKEVLQEADILCFVHSLVEGELDLNEMKFLRDNQSMVEKGIILLTKLDQQKESEQVISKIRKNLKSENINMEFFAISSERYQKYMGSKNENWLLKSNFLEVKEYLSDHIARVNLQRMQDKNHFSNDLIQLLESQLQELNQKIESLSFKLNKEKEGFQTELQNLIASL